MRRPGRLAASLVWAYDRFLQNIVSRTTLDLLHFSLHPLSASRIATRLRPDSAPRRRVLERRARLARDRGRLAAAPQRTMRRLARPPMGRGRAGWRRRRDAQSSDRYR